MTFACFHIKTAHNVILPYIIHIIIMFTELVTIILEGSSVILMTVRLKSNGASIIAMKTGVINSAEILGEIYCTQEKHDES